MIRRGTHTTKTVGLTALAVLIACCDAQAGDWSFEEFAAPYRQRLDGVTPSAGNAKQVNAVTHIIHPWPRRVGNRRIPANGERMVGAMERYRDPRKLRDAPPPMSFTTPSGSMSIRQP